MAESMIIRKCWFQTDFYVHIRIALIYNTFLVIALVWNESTLFCPYGQIKMEESSVKFSIFRLQIRFQKTSRWYSGYIYLYIRIGRVFIGGQNTGRKKWVGSVSSTNIVRLPRWRVDTVRALVHLIATDARAIAARNLFLITRFWQTYKLATWLAVAL